MFLTILSLFLPIGVRAWGGEGGCRTVKNSLWQITFSNGYSLHGKRFRASSTGNACYAGYNGYENEEVAD